MLINQGFQKIVRTLLALKKIVPDKVFCGDKIKAGSPVIIKEKSKLLFSDLDPIRQKVDCVRRHQAPSIASDFSPASND
jgi:hypothetical protein